MKERNGPNKKKKKVLTGISTIKVRHYSKVSSDCVTQASLGEEILATPLHHLHIFGSFWSCFLSRFLSRGPLKWGEHPCEGLSPSLSSDRACSELPGRAYPSSQGSTFLRSSRGAWAFLCPGAAELERNFQKSSA